MAIVGMEELFVAFLKGDARCIPLAVVNEVARDEGRGRSAGGRVRRQ